MAGTGRRRFGPASVASVCGLVAAIGVSVLATRPDGDNDAVDVTATVTSSTDSAITLTSDADVEADADGVGPLSSEPPTSESEPAAPLAQASTSTTPPAADPAATTTTAATQSPPTAPYDHSVPLPAWQTNRGFPLPASPPYRLEGDPYMDHRGDDVLDPRGCVWLITEAGETISVLWPPNWSVRFQFGGAGTSPAIEIRDELGRTRVTDAAPVGIVGGTTDQAFSHCRVSEVAYQVVGAEQKGP